MYHCASSNPKQHQACQQVWISTQCSLQSAVQSQSQSQLFIFVFFSLKMLGAAVYMPHECVCTQSQNALWLSMYIRLHIPIRAALYAFFAVCEQREEKRKREMKEKKRRKEEDKGKPPDKRVGIIQRRSKASTMQQTPIRQCNSRIFKERM